MNWRNKMNNETMLILLILMFIGYVIMSYRKLIIQHAALKELKIQIKTLQTAAKNTDKLRREYNAIARHYNHTLEGTIGKILAGKLKYEKSEMIEKI